MNDGKLKIIQTAPYLFDPFQFIVVNGVTKPTNPEPNTIWVKTTTAINGWTCSPVAPEDKTGNWVWIKVGTSSRATLQVLNQELVNDSIKCYPLKIAMYQSGAWLYTYSEIYNGIEWITPCVYLCDDSHMFETNFNSFSSGTNAGYAPPYLYQFSLSGNTFTGISQVYYVTLNIRTQNGYSGFKGRQLVVKLYQNHLNYNNASFQVGYSTSNQGGLVVSSGASTSTTEIFTFNISHDIIYPGFSATYGDGTGRTTVQMFDWYII